MDRLDEMNMQMEEGRLVVEIRSNLGSTDPKLLFDCSQTLFANILQQG